MDGYKISETMLVGFQHYLSAEERGVGTIEKYTRDVRAFMNWSGGQPVSKELLTCWKKHLQERAYGPATINTMLSALNTFFRFMGWNCRVKFLKIQRRLFREPSRELTRAEYDRLMQTAQQTGRTRLALLMETICATGIRVSEVRYITMEALKHGKAEISMKGKIRTILLPHKLCRKLMKYAGTQGITAGEVFLTDKGRSMPRKQIWAEMKALSKDANVAPSKVFPHNLRHLLARIFYTAYRDVARLADVLGHSSIETTRIYLISTGAEHVRQIERLHIVS